MRLIFSILAMSFLHSGEFHQESEKFGWRQSFDVTEMLHQEKTDLSEIAIFSNPVFGRILAVNGTIQAVEKDEAVYHEMLVHPALLAHEKPSSVLIIGGGDGSALREILRHKNVDKAVLVEADPRIIELTRQFIPSLSSGAFDDPRVTVVIQDAVQYIKDTKDSFDIILCDPSGAFVSPYTSQWYADCKKRLHSGGICIYRRGSPFLGNDELQSNMSRGRTHFTYVFTYVAPVPTAMGGVTAFIWTSDAKHTVSPAEIKKKMAQVIGKMQYYTPAMQKSAFVLPNFMKLSSVQDKKYNTMIRTKRGGKISEAPAG